MVTRFLNNLRKTPRSRKSPNRTFYRAQILIEVLALILFAVCGIVWNFYRDISGVYSDTISCYVDFYFLQNKGTFTMLSELPYESSFLTNDQDPDSIYQYRQSHCGDKMVARSSFLYSGIFYTGKMTSLYWTSPQLAKNVWYRHP